VRLETMALSGGGTCSELVDGGLAEGIVANEDGELLRGIAVAKRMCEYSSAYTISQTCPHNMANIVVLPGRYESVITSYSSC